MQKEVKVGARIAPPGRHVVRLADLEEIPGQFNKPCWRWTFEVIDGPHAGSRLVKTTGAVNGGVAPGSSLGDLLESLLGRRLVEGEAIDLDQLMAQRYQVFAVPSGTASGGRLTTIRPAGTEGGVVC
jgi:hypothetical protein